MQVFGQKNFERFRLDTQRCLFSISKTGHWLLLLINERVHELLEAQQTVAAADAGNLVVVLDIVGRDATVPDDEGHGLVDVDAQLNGRGVVGQDGHADEFVHLFYCLDDRTYQSLVEVVDGP